MDVPEVPKHRLVVVDVVVSYQRELESRIVPVRNGGAYRVLFAMQGVSDSKPGLAE